jgi:hypothetical protein
LAFFLGCSDTSASTISAAALALVSSSSCNAFFLASFFSPCHETKTNDSSFGVA